MCRQMPCGGKLSVKSAPTIAFEYRPSRLVAVVLVAAWLLGFAAIAFCALSLWWKIALVCAAGAYGALQLKNFLRPRFSALAWHQAGHWRLRDTDGNEKIAEL